MACGLLIDRDKGRDLRVSGEIVTSESRARVEVGRELKNTKRGFH